MWLTEATYPLLFASGLVGGIGHCAGMCGPLVAALSVHRGEGGAIRPQLLYHLGRITTYSMVGGIAGFTGSFLDVAGVIAPYQRAVLTATGMLIAVAGLVLGGWLHRGSPGARPGDAPGLLEKACRLLAGAGTAGAYFPLGLVLGFLPCGLVYAALLAAAREGMEAGDHGAGFLRGFLVMAVFGAGTVPALLVIGKAAGALSARARTRLARLSAAFVVLAGVLLAARGILH
ncbi:MAG: sulfite exporter TauE/SafE family protein [Gemmatimonadota bacterium]